MKVLLLDQQGHPISFIPIKDAIFYYATDDVVWDLGDPLKTYRGGFNGISQQQSQLTTAPIIAVRGESYFSRLMTKTPAMTNATLFARDHWTCGYCGHKFHHEDLTCDHIIPKSKGGKDNWLNCITCCGSCNNKKDSLSLEEFGRPLLFQPYVPTKVEKLCLRIDPMLPVQAEYLSRFVPEKSRSHQLLMEVIQKNE